MFRVTRYPMISKTESGRVGYRKKYRVAGRVRVPAGHCRRVTFSLPTMVIGDLNNVDLDHCHHDLGDLDQFDFDKWWPW